MKKQDINNWVKQNLTAGEWVLITGSTSGIGYEYLKVFADLGCNIICVSNEGDKLAEQKAHFEQTTKAIVKTFTIDLANTAMVHALANTLRSFPIKVLVNNAGFGLKGRFENQKRTDLSDIIAVNCIAPTILCHALLPGMQEANRGLVIHIASINALIPIPLNQTYTATKSYIYSYALATARENKNSGIDFQLVLPGTTKTPFHDKQGATPKHMTMLPEHVVEASLSNVKSQICIPNKGDRILAKIIPFLPITWAMDIASYLLKKRLGV